MSNMKVATALVGAQAELRAIVKDSTNPHFRNSYASLDGIIEAVRPVLARHDLAVSQGAEATQDGKALIVHTTLIHSSGETFGNQVYVPIGKQDAQGAGGALTYGRRYGLSALLCLATDEDDDGHTASRQPAPKRAEKPAPKSQTTSTPEDRVMPFGETKGKTLADHSTKHLQSIEKWCRHEDRIEKYGDLAKDISTVLANRALGEDPKSKDDRAVANMNKSVEREDAGLPF